MKKTDFPHTRRQAAVALLVNVDNTTVLRTSKITGISPRVVRNIVDRMAKAGLVARKVRYGDGGEPLYTVHRVNNSAWSAVVNRACSVIESAPLGAVTLCIS